MPEYLFVNFNWWDVHRLGSLDWEFLWNRGCRGLELLKKGWWDGQPVASCQFSNFCRVPEWCTHDNGLMRVFFEIVVDLCDWLDSWVSSSNILSWDILLEPVKDPPYEGRNKKQPILCAFDCLDSVKNKSHIAVDMILFELSCCLDSLPSTGNLDQDSVFGNTILSVKTDYSFGNCNSFLSVKGQAGIDFSWNVTWNLLEDFTPETNWQVIAYESFEFFLLLGTQVFVDDWCLCWLFLIFSLLRFCLFLRWAMSIEVVQPILNWVLHDVGKLWFRGNLKQ